MDSFSPSVSCFPLHSQVNSPGLISCLRLTPLPFSGILPIRYSLHPNLENIPGPFLPQVSSSPLISVSKLGMFCHLHQTGPFPRPKKLCYPISGRDDKAPCPPTEAFPSQGSVAGLGQRPPLCQRQKRVEARDYVERKVHSHSFRRPSISLCSSSFLR